MASGTSESNWSQNARVMEAKQQIVTRKPKLAPIRVVNTHHLRYIQEKEREKELQTLMTAGQKTGGLAVDRPVSQV